MNDMVGDGEVVPAGGFGRDPRPRDSASGLLKASEVQNFIVSPDRESRLENDRTEGPVVA